MLDVHSPRPCSRLVAALLAALAAAALMQSTLLVLVDPGLLGWQPGHGHVFLDGNARPHRHPGDAGTPGAPVEAAPGTVFTATDRGVAGAVASALVLPAALAIAGLAASAWGVAAALSAPPRAVALPAPTPPPRA